MTRRQNQSPQPDEESEVDQGLGQRPWLTAAEYASGKTVDQTEAENTADNSAQRSSKRAKRAAPDWTPLEDK